MSRSHPSPKQLATYLRALAKKLDHSGGLALEQAELLAARGWPASVSGNGSRSSDTTSSTERAALTAGPWAGIDSLLADDHRALWLAALELEGRIDDVLAHDSDVDQLPPGTGYCVCGCERFCSPRQNGPDDRLRAGLAPACHRRYLRWREDGHPDANVPDYCTALRRARERVAEEEARLAQLKADLRR